MERAVDRGPLPQLAGFLRIPAWPGGALRQAPFRRESNRRSASRDAPASRREQRRRCYPRDRPPATTIVVTISCGLISRGKKSGNERRRLLPLLYFALQLPPPGAG